MYWFKLFFASLVRFCYWFMKCRKNIRCIKFWRCVDGVSLCLCKWERKYVWQCVSQCMCGYVFVQFAHMYSALLEWKLLFAHKFAVRKKFNANHTKRLIFFYLIRKFDKNIEKKWRLISLMKCFQFFFASLFEFGFYYMSYWLVFYFYKF